jgi:acyl carrier protein
VLSDDTTAELLPRVIQVVRDNLRLGEAAARLDSETLLFDGGLELDSIDIVELIALIERTFAIQFEYDDLDPEYFRTMGTLAALIARCRVERA